MNDELKAEMERELRYRWPNIEFSKRHIYDGFSPVFYAKIDDVYCEVPSSDIADFYSAIEHVDWDYIAQKLINSPKEIPHNQKIYLFRDLTQEQEQMITTHGCIRAFSPEEIKELGVTFCKLPSVCLYGVQLVAKSRNFIDADSLKCYIKAENVKYIHDVKVLPDDTLRARIMEPAVI